jgi:hypothetical protein
MSNAFLYRMGAGYAGAISRIEALVAEPNQLDRTTPPGVFGVPVKLVAGKIQICKSSDVPYGFLIRPYPTQANVNEALNAGTPDPNQLCDVMRSGYMQVKCTAGTPAKNADVYFNSSTGLVQAESGTKIDNCKFMGTADSNGLVEIAYNI